MRKSRDRRSAGPVLDQAYRAQLQSRGRKVFGRALRGFRQQLGSNQEDLGDALNIDQSGMSRVERDKMKPDERLLLGLLAQFHDTGVLADAAEAYCFARHLRYEDWYSDRVVRAKIHATFRELPPTWNQIQLLYTQVPPLSAAHYVPRTAFVGRLLARVKQSASPGVTGLWGLPGAGKTMILQALGHEPETWEAFDLVLWSEIGPTAGEEQIRCQLADWAALLALPVAPGAPLPTLAMAVRDSLSTRRVLLLVDDAWNGPPLSLLLQAIPFGHAVVTTRVKSVIDSLDMGADIWEVPTISLDEARTLIGNVTGKAIDAGAEAETALTEIYDLVEGPPLALNLAAPCIRDLGWARTLAQLRERQTRLALLERDQVLTRHDGVRIAFMLSYDCLGAGDRRQRQAHFRALGVLACAPFSASAAGAVWRQANVAAAEQELLRLYNVSLVQCREGIDGRLSFRLHTLVHDLARELLEERDNEMSEATDRYIQHQGEVAEALRRRLGTQDEPLAQVVSEFAAELPHIDHVFRAMLRRGSRRLLRQDAVRLASLLRHSRHLLLYSGRMPLWQEWLDELEPRVVNSHSRRLQDQALGAEWHFQTGASLLVRHEFDASRSFL